MIAVGRFGSGVTPPLPQCGMTHNRELSWLEKIAEEATTLDYFNTINIRDVRSVVENLLRDFGRNGFLKNTLRTI